MRDSTAMEMQISINTEGVDINLVRVNNICHSSLPEGSD